MSWIFIIFLLPVCNRHSLETKAEKGGRWGDRERKRDNSLDLIAGGEKEELMVIQAVDDAAEAVKFHVLAVDDSFIDRKLIERLLKTSAYHVTAVDSGSKALEVLGLREEQANPSTDHIEIEVNLVITDYCMPGMTGYDLLQKIKGSSLLKNIPVVIMSSENVPSRINRCLEGGAEEFFLKPVQLSDMKRLKLHMLKGKTKEQELLQQYPVEENKQQQKHQQEEKSSNICSSNSSNSDSGGISKRKAMEKGLSPERTRPRFSSSSLSVT